MTDFPHQRSRFGRLMRFTIDPIFDYLYWRLDLNDASGRPDHAKVLGTIAFLGGCFWLLVFAPIVLEACQKQAPGCGLMLASFFAGFVFVSFLAFGLAGLRVWGKTRGGGTTDALGEVASSFEEAARSALQTASPEGRERAADL